MIASPSLTAVTLPELETVATFVLLLFQVPLLVSVVSLGR